MFHLTDYFSLFKVLWLIHDNQWAVLQDCTRETGSWQSTEATAVWKSNWNFLWRDHTASVKTITKNLEENWSQTSTNKRYLYFILGVFILLELMLWVNEQLSILFFLRLLRMLLTNTNFYCGNCINISEYLTPMFEWTLAASMIWSSQILEGEFRWLSCDTIQREERKWMLGCCNIASYLFLSQIRDETLNVYQ